MKKHVVLFFVLMLSVAPSIEGFGRDHTMSRLHLGLGGGFGLPKISYSQYRTPISFLVNGSLPVQVKSPVWVQATGGALTTIHMGTVNDSDDDMRFNLTWAGLEGMYRLRYDFHADAFVTAGLGYYHLSQLYDGNEDILNTTGFTLALVNWSFGPKWNSTLEIRWHLLFEPEENPQVLTITFGVLF